MRIFTKTLTVFYRSSCGRSGWTVFIRSTARQEMNQHTIQQLQDVICEKENLDKIVLTNWKREYWL